MTWGEGGGARASRSRLSSSPPMSCHSPDPTQYCTLYESIGTGAIHSPTAWISSVSCSRVDRTRVSLQLQ